MTVTELIEQLQKCPAEAKVWTDNGYSYPIKSILISPGGGNVVIGPFYHSSLLKLKYKEPV